MTKEVLLAVDDVHMLESSEALVVNQLEFQHVKLNSFLWPYEIRNDNEVAMPCKNKMHLSK